MQNIAEVPQKEGVLDPIRAHEAEVHDIQQGPREGSSRLYRVRQAGRGRRGPKSSGQLPVLSTRSADVRGLHDIRVRSEEASVLLVGRDRKSTV